MSDTPEALIVIARKWLTCFETHDVDALVALYSDDARHTSPKLRERRPETGGYLVGKSDLHAWWADAFRRLPQLRYREQTLTSDGVRVFMEYLRVVPGEADMPVAEVLEVRGGKIVASRVYHG